MVWMNPWSPALAEIRHQWQNWEAMATFPLVVVYGQNPSEAVEKAWLDLIPKSCVERLARIAMCWADVAPLARTGCSAGIPYSSLRTAQTTSRREPIKRSAGSLLEEV
ncbi:hypothetical protein AC578_2676 [Pseudocercospora eumusae]|uniref:Uncharacterized protein n=1 Tax=Pseudocercospora eumusae TaxID=321146 RepID=A0A139H1A8_9PEZI|nr:hypothetical protein AC578_2676 [Pseudocercospora eumusae]